MISARGAIVILKNVVKELEAEEETRARPLWKPRPPKSDEMTPGHVQDWLEQQPSADYVGEVRTTTRNVLANYFRELDHDYGYVFVESGKVTMGDGSVYQLPEWTTKFLNECNRIPGPYITVRDALIALRLFEDAPDREA